MIFLKTPGGQRTLILSPTSIEEMKQGRTIQSPDKTVNLMYSPDVVWLSEQIKEAAAQGELNLTTLECLQEMAMQRPPVAGPRGYAIAESVKDGKLTTT